MTWRPFRAVLIPCTLGVMTSCRDLGQFDLTSLFNLLPEGAVKKTVQDVTAIAQNPITGAVKSIEFYTAFSPPTVYTGKELDAIYRDDTPNPYLKVIQPVINIDSVLGKRTLAPYGDPGRTVWQTNQAKVKQLGKVVIITAGFSVVGLLIAGAALGRLRK